MRPEQYIAAEAEFARLAREMLGCIVRLLEARGPAASERSPAPAQPPDIPDAPPPSVSAPATALPDVPDDGEPQQTDAEFLAGFDGVLGTCADMAAVDKAVAANKPEVEERGLEQAAHDLIEKHRAHVKWHGLGADGQKGEYTRIILAMRGCWHVTPPDAAFAALKGVVGHERALIGAMPERWQHELRAEKDRVLEKIRQQREKAA